MSDPLTLLDGFWGLAGLALIAFGDTLIGVGFFVFGEVAFLAAGAAFAANGTTLPGLVVLIAAWAGDIVSFYVGRRFGFRIALPLLKRRKRRSAWRRAKKALAARGVVFVIVSRLLGPVAWITPFLAGTLHMPPLKFAFAAAIGVALGVGQFLILGAVGQQVWALMTPSTSWLPALLAITGLGLGLALMIWRQRTRGA